MPIAIELRHIRYFLAVFEELHFGRAAERLHIAQPPLSQAIRKLEAQLGVQLLERTSRTVAPTEAGRAFAKEGRAVLASVERAVGEARRAAGIASSLRIGCIPNLSIERLLQFLTRLHERDPSIEARVTHVTALEQVPRLRNGELDFGIFYDVAAYDDLETRPLFPGEQLAAFLSADHPLAKKQVLTVDDLRDEALVTFPREANPELHDRVLARIAEAGYQFSDVRGSGGINPRDLVLAIAEGMGVGVAPATLGVDDVTSIVTCRPLEPAVSMPNVVVAWPSHPRQPEALLMHAREIAESIFAETRDQD